VTDRTPDRPAGREPGAGQLTTRQLGGYVLIAALVLAIGRLLRGAARGKRG
jgi:hypothetical protein